MRLKSRGMLAVVVLSLSAFAISAWANHEKKGDRSFPTPRMIEELGLSQDQVKQIKIIHDKSRKEGEEKKKEVKEDYQKLGEAMGKETSDADLKKLFMSLQDTKRALAEAKFDKMLEIRKILTPEQRKKFKELRGKYHHKHWHSDE